MSEFVTDEINLPLNSLSCVWKDFSSISIFKQSTSEKKTQFNKNDDSIFDIKNCSTLCNSEFTIRFLKSCHAIFSSLPSTLSQEETLKISKNYRIALATCSHEIEEHVAYYSQNPLLSDENRMKYLQTTSETFNFYELVWYLAEIFFMSKEDENGQISLLLMNWIKSQSNDVVMKAKEIYEQRENLDIEKLWDAILSLLIYHEIEHVIALLELHPKSNFPKFRILRRLIGSIPEITGQNNVEKDWVFWQNECRTNFSANELKKIEDTEEEDIDECYIRIIGSILNGSDYIWSHPLILETIGDSTNWYIRFCGKLFYCNRFISSNDIAYELNDWNKMCQDEGDEVKSLSKEIIEAILSKDLTGFLNLCSSRLNCWWTAVHFLHLLAALKPWVLKTNKECKDKFNILDLMIIGFVDSILSTNEYSLVPLALSYLDTIAKKYTANAKLMNQVRSREAKILENLKPSSNKVINWSNQERITRSLEKETVLLIKNDLIHLPDSKIDGKLENLEVLRRVLVITSKLLSQRDYSFGLLDKLIHRSLHVISIIIDTIMDQDMDLNDPNEALEELTEMVEVMSSSLLKYFSNLSHELSPTSAFFITFSKLVSQMNSRDDNIAVQTLLELLSYQAIVIPNKLKTVLLQCLTNILIKADAEKETYSVDLSFDQIQTILSIIPLDCNQDLNRTLVGRLSKLQLTIF